MTQTKINYKYDAATQIFYKYYKGLIDIEDLKSSWLELIDKGLIPSKTKRFLLDYTKATYITTPNSADDILKFYNANKQVFLGAKIALIMQDPDQVVLPILVDQVSSFASFKPFYTANAAIDWLRKF